MVHWSVVVYSQNTAGGEKLQIRRKDACEATGSYGRWRVRATHSPGAARLSGVGRHGRIEKRELVMLKFLQGVHPLLLLVIATTLEVSGDAVVRMGIYNHVGVVRVVLLLAGAALLLGYGSFLNLAPFDFGRVVGLYLATLFVVWQLINFIAFRALPTMPILVGGALVIAGGAIITFWKPA